MKDNDTYYGIEANKDTDKKLQKILSKLIAEEMLANMQYHMSVLACKEPCKLNEMFKTIAQDELLDHHKTLCLFALQNGYSIPLNETDYKKHADEKCWKLYDSLKRDKDAKYYIEAAIKAEEAAIASYEEAMEYDEIPYELYASLQAIRFDEIEHLRSLHTLMVAEEASANLIWTSIYDTQDKETAAYWW